MTKATYTYSTVSYTYIQLLHSILFLKERWKSLFSRTVTESVSGLLFSLVYFRVAFCLLSIPLSLSLSHPRVHIASLSAAAAIQPNHHPLIQRHVKEEERSTANSLVNRVCLVSVPCKKGGEFGSLCAVT